jgi:hypothetical protein
VIIYFPAAQSLDRSIPVVARSEAGTAFARSNAVIVSSIPTQGIDVCVVLCVGSGLAAG